MVSVPFGRDAYKRTYSGEPEVRMLNRFFEQSPTNLVEQQALLSRPGTTRFTSAGSGKVRALHSQTGAFNSDLFIVVNDSLYRYRKSDKSVTQIIY